MELLGGRRQREEWNDILTAPLFPKLMPQHRINIDDRIAAVRAMLRQSGTSIVALVGMGGIGR